MDSKTEMLIRELAEKLGITGEYLWSALMRQAPITATIDLIVMIAMVFAVIFAFRFVKAKTTKVSTENDICSEPEWGSDAAFIAWFFLSSFCCGVMIMICCSLSITLSGFFNPEYWALKQILSAAK